MAKNRSVSNIIILFGSHALLNLVFCFPSCTRSWIANQSDFCHRRDPPPIQHTESAIKKQTRAEIGQQTLSDSSRLTNGQPTAGCVRALELRKEDNDVGQSETWGSQHRSAFWSLHSSIKQKSDYTLRCKHVNSTSLAMTTIARNIASFVTSHKGDFDPHSDVRS